MRRRVAVVLWAMVLVAMVMVASPPAFAQGGSTSTTLSGSVVDAQNAVIPGAEVVVKHNGTGATYPTVTDGTGHFSVAGVTPGVYTVTVSLMGFKTAVAPDVTVAASTPTAVKMTLQIGELAETVVVTGATEIVQTQSATVSTTIAIKQIQQLPVITHTALDFVVSLPGIETPNSVLRSATIHGLPTTSINITLDGINVQDKRGSEGMYMFIRPMMDSVEEVTVSTSNDSAAATGAGASNIKMETRSGSNRFSASVYNTWRNQAGTNDKDGIARTQHPSWLWGLNTPYWFNKRDLPKTKAGDYFINDIRLQTPGFRVGGPVIKDKLFYFFNYEEFKQPDSRSRTRYILGTNAQNGLFSYPANDGSGTKTVNLYTIAANNGQTSTPDPSIGKLLTDIRTATATTGAVSTYDVNLDQYDYVPTATQFRSFPTVRMDYNLTSAHRLSVTYRYNKFDSTPDFLNSAESRFPGFPNLAGQVSGRYMWQASIRSTLGKSMVNEARGGQQNTTGLGTYFGQGVDSSQFACTGLGCQQAGGIGWNWYLPSLSQTLTSATAYGGQSAGNAAQSSFEDTLTWLKGKHSISMGGSWQQIKMRNFGSTPYPATLYFGTSSLDTTAYNMLDYSAGAANFPGGITSTYSGYAKNLYGLLTGRVTQLSTTYYLQPDGTYTPNGDRTNQTTANDLGFFASDSWRMKPNFTLTLGVRYQVQLPMTTDGQYSRPQTWQMVYGITGAGTGLYGSGNLFHPGVMTGTNPVVVPYVDGNPAYNTDWNNVAPSVGFTWRPNIKSGILSSIMSKDPVFRGGYAITYTKLGTSFFDSNYSGDPGRSRAGSRTATTGAPFLGSDGWPVLLRDTSRLTPSAAPAPLTGNSWSLVPAINETIDIHYPNWPVPLTHQFSFGIQRELGKSMALDVRYVGNVNVGGWSTQTITSTANWSMLKGENGFYDEFRLAQANLRANIIAGKGNTFAYTGAAGTSPLPIFMAYLKGIPLADARNQDPTQYSTVSQFTTSSWYSSLSMYSPAMTTIAGTGTSGLQNGITLGTGLDANRIAANLPINFFMANPALASGNAYLETTSGNTKFNAIQIELRRRMSAGFLIAGNYQYSFNRETWTQRSLRENWFYIPSTGGPDQSFKVNFVYELPFGHGKPFGGGASKIVDGFIGGWEVDGVGRIQTGPKFNYGGYRLVGMTDKQFQDMFKFYHVKDANGLERIYMLPQDVIQNSILALYTQSATTASGYSGTLPTGAYLAPASGPDCVQYYSGQCPGTSLARIITGPMYWKVDLSIVKRIALYKSLRLEGRMDLFNLFDTINFTPTSAMGSSLTSWQVTAAASDTNGSQDPGGRITQFSLRLTW